ncbi:MAG: carboxypeptidase-like regulatory domain-containing protein [Bacteroidota bacterium]
MLTKYLLTVLSLLLSLIAYTQTPQLGTLSGTVTDDRGEPLFGITILVKNTDRGEATDLDGQFTITNIPPSRYTLAVSGIGYEEQSFEVTVKTGNNELPTITLVESTTLLDGVTVTAQSEKTRLESTAQAIEVIETKEVKLQSADLGEIMAKTEGVNVQRSGGLGSGFRFSLNGLSGDQVRFFFDGVPLNFSPYGFGIANVPVNMIDRVEIFKGVVPVQFGADALGGAVNLVPPSVRNGWSGAASYQTGSFGTHRVTGNLNYADEQTGLFVVAGGFFDYTDNNYKIDVAVDEMREDGTPTGRLKQVTVRRFHDAYQAYGANLKIGIRDKKWADELSLEAYYGNYDNEIQNSQSPGLIDEPSLGISQAVAGNPFGELRFTSVSKGLNLNYRLTPNDQWDIHLQAGYNDDERVSIDTSRNLYNWFGEVIRVNRTAGEFELPDNLITISQAYYARQQVAYKFSPQHALKLSVAPTYSYRTGDDLLVDGPNDPALDEGFLFDLVTGLEYTAKLLDERLENIAFAKNYRQSVRNESFDPSTNSIFLEERTASNFGAGNGLRYSWTDRLTTKVSYEFAYRLPRQDEIFGDGQLVIENLELLPENSHNVNFATSLRSQPSARTDWQVQANVFVRQIDNLILLLVDQEGFGSFENVWSATSQGIELGGRWADLVPGLAISANTTYQRYYNTSDDGPFASFEGDRIPNTPYLFANGSLEYQREDLLRSQDRLSLFLNTRYVHEFFIGWESAGLRQFKQSVPAQLVHSAGLTYQMLINDRQVAFTLDSQNITNAKVFDLFGVQRPGRAFFFKTTINF